MKLAEIAKRYIQEVDDKDPLRNVQIDPNAQSGVDPAADEESKVILLINKLEQLPEVIQELQNLNLLSSKYKAIQEFANLLGIKPEQFDAVMQQARIQSTI
jgi:hypothetical protein